MNTTKTLTPEQLQAMRAWIKDCLGTWRDLLDDDDVDELIDREVVAGIELHYVGGVEQFLKDN